MIYLHIFTEEPSIEKVFNAVLPKLLNADEVHFKIYPHQGKSDLEHALRTTLPSISKIPNSRILITRDQDLYDCKNLKQQLNDIVKDACNCPYLIRIVCRELEAWFLGDMNAVKQAYPRFEPDKYQNSSKFRDVDTIQSPNERLKEIIPDYEKFDNLPKNEVAARVAKYLTLDNNFTINRSPSFQNTMQAIQRLVSL